MAHARRSVAEEVERYRAHIESAGFGCDGVGFLSGGVTFNGFAGLFLHLRKKPLLSGDSFSGEV